jgi:hypothetical protein
VLAASQLRILVGEKIGDAQVELSIRNGRELTSSWIDPRRPEQWVEVATFVSEATATDPAQRVPIDQVMKRISKAVGYHDPLLARGFPIGELPAAMGDLVSLGRMHGHPAEVYAMPALSCAAMAIGRSYHLRVRGTWWEPAMLWTVTAAPVGSGKTPGIEAATEPLYRWQAQLDDEYRAALKLAKEQVDEWDRARKDQSRGPKPDLPVVPMLITSDATTEVLARRMHDNPRGSGFVSDEFAAFVMGMDAYRQQGRAKVDRARWCSIWSSKRIDVDRVRDEDARISVLRPHLSLCAAVPLEVLPHLSSKPDEAPDGFWGRFLIAVTEEDADPWFVGDIPERGSAIWAQTLTELLRQPSDVSREVRLDERALVRFGSYMGEIRDRQRSTDIVPQVREFLGKCPSQLGRIALVLHLTDRAGLQERGDPIPQDTVERAWKILEYLIAQREPLQITEPGFGPERFTDAPADRVLQYMKRKGLNTLNVRQLQMARIPGIRDATEADRVLHRLVGRGDVIEADRGDGRFSVYRDL